MASRAGRLNALTDVPGLRVGHAQRIGEGWLSGTTVVLAPPGGAVAAVDVRGGGPGTRETDALDPRNLVQRVEAVVLTGGSAFGLAAADGVMAWLEERERGFPVGPGRVVPVVPAAALFDLGRGGDWRARPGAALGRTAAEAAWAAGEGVPVPQGAVGAGTGAHTEGGLKGGIGTASAVVPLPAAEGREACEVTVAALVALNAAGSPVDPATGLPYGAFAEVEGEFGRLGGLAGAEARGPLPEAVRRRAAERLAEAAGAPAPAARPPAARPRRHGLRRHGGRRPAAQHHPRRRRHRRRADPPSTPQAGRHRP
ncbi:P1 family peptidase [Phaeacidiphilus oryzae]|uniref:P1 family peptidase n=1 Tax=Phaeacidiphilus oryzae TaxID=348818 RepID=UPI000AE4E795